PKLDVDANELALVYRARGMTPADAEAHAREVLGGASGSEPVADRHESVGTAWSAALSSFGFFSSGAVIPVLPFLFLDGVSAVILASVLVGVALLATGSVVGLLSGASPLRRALRQLAIGYAAAAATYLLGL